MNILALAIKYLELGWSIIPILKESKKPAIAWKEFQNRRMTPIEAIKHFSGDVNIGLVCGDISGVLVIDDDTYKKKEGDSVMEMDTPLVAKTPRGGKHFYFKYKEGGNTVNQELAMDIRSKGGYVLLPPSFVKYDENTSGSYSWNVEPSKEILEGLPEAPQSLLTSVYGSSGGQVATDVFSIRKEVFKPSFDISSALNLKEGGRNNSLSRLALSLLNKVTQEEAWNLVNASNNTFDPPLSENEVLTVFNSALKKFKESPTIVPKKNRTQQELVVNNDFKHTSLSEDIEGVKKIFIEGKKIGESTGFSELDMIIGGYIGGQSYLIYADTSIGKSIFSVNSMVSLAKRGIKTLYFDLENPMELTIERLAFVSSSGLMSLKGWRKAQENKDKDFIDSSLDRINGLSLDIWDLNKLTERFGDITWEGIKKCIEEAVDTGVKVVFLDHLHYFSPSESDHAVLGEVMRQVNNLCANYNISIVVVAHTKKGLTYTKDDVVKVQRPTIDHISGSGLIAKHCKNIISLQRNPASEIKAERELTTVFIDKTKFGPTGKIHLRFAEEQLCFFDEGIDELLRKQNSEEDDEEFEPKIIEKKEEVIVEKDPIDEMVDELVRDGKW